MFDAASDETFGRRFLTRPRLTSPDNHFLYNDTGRESLRSLINHLYGEDVYRLIRCLEASRKKKARLLCSLTFLLRCRDNGVIPRFLRQKRCFNTASSHRIYNRMESALLRERIHQTRRELAFNDSTLMSLHLQVSSILSRQDWEKVDRITYSSMISTSNQATTRQKKKFDNCSKLQSTTANDPKHIVINLSDYQLSENETTVLAKGANFAVIPSTIPTEDIIANIEAGIRHVSGCAAEEIRRECARVLQRAKPPKSNLSGAEKAALKTLNNNKEIVISTADKGNATVIMNVWDYQRKISELLDPASYRKLPSDPTSRLIRKTNQLIKQSSIPVEKQRQLINTEAQPPRLYGLPKVHKPEVPLRPIVSAIYSHMLVKLTHTSRIPHILFKK